MRRRLVEALRSGVQGPLTLISAPAGYGKSVLVASWAEEAGGAAPLMFLQPSLDEGEDSPPGFWASVLDGLHDCGIDVTGAEPPAVNVTVDRAALRNVAERVVRDGPLAWVLDFSDTTLSPAIAADLHRFIGWCAGSLHVVLLTRSDPPLPLNRYRLAGALTEIRAGDLAFTASEVAALMHQADLDLSAPEVAVLHGRTGGWPAGLRFAAMSLSGRRDLQQAIAEVRGDAGNIAAYLMSEVLAQQPPELREFLLRTCLVDELDPAMAAALTGRHCDSQTLPSLARGSSFVEPVPGRPGRYRYQPLFREFLRAQALFEQAELVPVLHRRAAEQCAQSGNALAAVRHSVSAQDWGRATRHLVEGGFVGALLVGRRRTALRELFDQMPADVDGLHAAVTRAGLSLGDLDVVGALTQIDAARRHLVHGTRDRGSAGVLAVTVLAAVAASLDDDVEAGLDAALSARAALRAAGGDLLYPELSTVVAGCEARVLFQRNELTAARDALSAGVRAADQADLAEESSQLRGMAALVEAASGHLKRAASLLQRAGTSPAGDLALAWVRVDEYRLDEAHALLARAEAGPTGGLDDHLLGPVLQLLQGRLLLARGDLDLARVLLRSARSRALLPTPAGWLGCTLAATQARSLIALGRPLDAVRLLEDISDGAHTECALVLQQALAACGRAVPVAPEPVPTEKAPLAVRVQCWLDLGARSAESGDAVEAERLVERALHLAASENLRRPFLDAPEAVQAMLQRRELRSRHRWLSSTPAAHGKPDSPSPATATGSVQAPALRAAGPLTAKEHEVLGYLADLLTTEEIAVTMFVSVNTVRSHVRSILRKLGVARRNEAVRRAWEMGILPPRAVA